MGPLIALQQRDKVDGGKLAGGGSRPFTGGGLAFGSRLLHPDPCFGPTSTRTARSPRSEGVARCARGDAYEDDDDAVRTPTIRSTACPAPSSAAGSRAGDGPPDPHGDVLDQRRKLRSDAPFGGPNSPGIGREMGEAGLDEFLERKTFATVLGPPRPVEARRVDRCRAGSPEGS